MSISVSNLHVYRLSRRAPWVRRLSLDQKMLCGCGRVQRTALRRHRTAGGLEERCALVLPRQQFGHEPVHECVDALPAGGSNDELGEARGHVPVNLAV